MADGDTTTEPIEPPPAPPKDTSRPGISLEQWERYKADLRRELEQQKDASAKEINELKEALQDATDFIKELKDGLAAREEAKEDNTTIVVPPDQLSLPPQQEQSISPGNEEGSTKKSGWKRWV